MKYEKQIYSGMLGKMIGVYMGRPVEGWPYDDIQKRYDEIWTYVNRDLKIPLIVADDDLSGMCTFFRAVKDSKFNKNLTAAEVGDAWLNYIINKRTILWWGGIGNSTEHTAYLNLANGIKAPQSGSIAQNGKTMATQIGSQIFMDAYALMNPADPDRAVYFVDKAASVSHDGIALEGACFLAALESMAFEEKNLDKLFDECSRRYIKSDELRKMVDWTRNTVPTTPDWHDLRDRIEEDYGYHKFLGPCPFITNHVAVLAGILWAGDDFNKSVMFGTSAGWDTDCNAGNIGCFNGIRLGLEGINQGADLITPMADRLIIVSGKGSECFTDGTREARKIVEAKRILRGEKVEEHPRFDFSFPYSMQGFQKCPYSTEPDTEVIHIGNEKGEGLELDFTKLAKGVNVSISTPTFFDVKETFSAYEMYASPSLYETQDVKYKMTADSDVYVKPFVYVVDRNRELQRLDGDRTILRKGTSEHEWRVPETCGLPITKFGFEFSANERFDGRVVINSIDWSNTPAKMTYKGIMMRDMWDLDPFWCKAFTPSADMFAPNLKHTFCISHIGKNGLGVTGSEDFKDYEFESGLSFSLHDRGGMVARYQGQRRYYAAVFTGHDTVSLIRKKDDEEVVLASTAYKYGEFELQRTCFSVVGNELVLTVNGKELLRAKDEDYTYMEGAIGYMVDNGSMFIDDLFFRGK